MITYVNSLSLSVATELVDEIELSDGRRFHLWNHDFDASTLDPFDVFDGESGTLCDVAGV